MLLALLSLSFPAQTTGVVSARLPELPNGRQGMKFTEGN